MQQILITIKHKRKNYEQPITPFLCRIERNDEFPICEKYQNKNLFRFLFEFFWEITEQIWYEKFTKNELWQLVRPRF